MKEMYSRNDVPAAPSGLKTVELSNEEYRKRRKTKSPTRT